MIDTPTPLTVTEQLGHVAQAAAAAGAALASLGETFAAALAPVAQQLAALHRALQDAGLIDADGNPVRQPADRPAWQTPYGPPQHRH